MWECGFPGWPPKTRDTGKSREQIVDEIMDATDGVANPDHIQTPALNKWGKVYPVKCKLLLGMGIHNYLGIGLDKVPRKLAVFHRGDAANILSHSDGALAGGDPDAPADEGARPSSTRSY